MNLRPDRRRALGWLTRACFFTPLAMSTHTIPAAATTPVTTLPPELHALLPRARLLGSGVLRFFGLRVYEARLWVGGGFEAPSYAQHPFALELSYDRKLDGEAIAERSAAEMRRIDHFSEAQGQRWLALMKQAFPDVVSGDRLLGFNDGQGRVQFFRNGEATVQIDDAEYARLFFGIWLAPQTSAPALRESLLGPLGQS